MISDEGSGGAIVMVVVGGEEGIGIDKYRSYAGVHHRESMYSLDKNYYLERKNNMCSHTIGSRRFEVSFLTM